MSSKGYKVVVAGASGAVGREMLRMLAERDFPVSEIAGLASDRSVGREVSFGDKKVIKLQSLSRFDFKGWDLALFATGSSLSERYVPIAAAAGCMVIDNSSHFRLDPDVPLVVPEVNGDALRGHKGRIVANPNCSTAQLMLPLKALDDAFGLKRVVVSTYQSVSGVGTGGMDELFNQTRKSFLTDGDVDKRHFQKQIAFNVLPHIGSFLPDGETDEERKMAVETRKILDGRIPLIATCVRVPVFIGHSEAVVVECAKPVKPSGARRAMGRMPGVTIFDHMDGATNKEARYATPIETVHEDNVFISRIRTDKSVENGVAFWCVANNLRKGAALNAVQIAELLAKDGRMN